MKIAEPHYTHQQIAVVYQRSDRWALEAIKAGKFGRDVIREGRDFLVPLSGVQFFEDNHRVFAADGVLQPVLARTPGEARRKLRLRQFTEVAA